jgi:hypothetical protein
MQHQSFPPQHHRIQQGESPLESLFSTFSCCDHREPPPAYATVAGPGAQMRPHPDPYASAGYAPQHNGTTEGKSAPQHRRSVVCVRACRRPRVRPLCMLVVSVDSCACACVFTARARASCERCDARRIFDKRCAAEPLGIRNGERGAAEPFGVCDATERAQWQERRGGRAAARPNVHKTAAVPGYPTRPFSPRGRSPMRHGFDRRSTVC